MIETYAQRKAARVFRGCDRRVGENPQRCKIVWPGPLTPEGTPVDIREGRYRRERQRACYELKGERTRPSDRIVATCDNPQRCMDQRHIRVIPAPKPPKPPRPSRARVAAASAVPNDADATKDDPTPPAAAS